MKNLRKTKPAPSRLVDSKGNRVGPGSVLVNRLGWEMKILHVGASCVLVERVGQCHMIAWEDIAGAGWRWRR